MTDPTARVMQLIGRVAGEARTRALGPADPLFESEVLDSLSMVELVASLEGEFGIAFTEDELTPEHFDSAKAIAALIRTKLG